MTEICRIASLCDDWIRRHGTRNPFELAEAEGITVRLCPEFRELKGMYKVILDQRFVFLNGNLRRREAKRVLAHELGHDALHREMGASSIVQDYFLLDMRLRPEYEANLFAAHLILEDEETLSYLKEGLSVAEAAKRLRVPEEFLKLKIEILRARGQI